MDTIYLDNSATTRPCKEAIDACNEAMNTSFGNPSSVHSMGKQAADLLNNSRNTLLSAILGESVKAYLPKSAALRSAACSKCGELIFTGSGTEADDLAIFGSTLRYAENANNYKIITTDSEHPAVLEPFGYLKKLGFQVAYIGTKNGILDIEQLRRELTPNTVLVSMMLANNETGAVYDIKSAFKEAHSVSKNIVCHTDAVQAFQKMQFTATELGADMVSVSAHKVHALKGVGALWISPELVKKKRIDPYIMGGGQEDGLRSGTENIPGISAFAAAVKANGGATAGKAFREICEGLRNVLISNLPDGVRENVPEGDRLPHIVSLTLPIPRSQPMLNYLSARGIYISAGSACSSKKSTPSHTLTAFGLSSEAAFATIRVSFDSATTEDELIRFCQVLADGVKTLY